MMGQLGSSWGTPLDNGQQARQHAEDAIYGQRQHRASIRNGSRENSRSANAASTNQGIDPNSAAWPIRSKSITSTVVVTDAYGQASLRVDASMLGGQEAAAPAGNGSSVSHGSSGGNGKALQQPLRNAAESAACRSLGAVSGGAPAVRNRSAGQEFNDERHSGHSAERSGRGAPRTGWAVGMERVNQPGVLGSPLGGADTRDARS
jgi:hypothetical protein